MIFIYIFAWVFYGILSSVSLFTKNKYKYLENIKNKL
jgi:hypothetical protein